MEPTSTQVPTFHGRAMLRHLCRRWGAPTTYPGPGSPIHLHFSKWCKRAFWSDCGRLVAFWQPTRPALPRNA